MRHLLPPLLPLLVATACARAPSPPRAEAPPVPLDAYVGARIWTAPDAAPIDDGVLLVEAGRVRAVGPRAQVAVPAVARVHDLAGRVVVPGYWDAHVHLVEEPFSRAQDASPAELADALGNLLLSRGFVHVLDAGSGPSTLVLRRRVEAGEVHGPDVLTAQAPLVPVDGTPRYVPFPLPEASSPEAVRAHVRAQLDAGADAVKLFTASLTRQRPLPVMGLAQVRAAVEAAHARGAPVLAHPTNRAGVDVAVEGGVDVLMHTAPIAGPLPAELLRRMVERRVALVPTLALWEHELRAAGDPEAEVAPFTAVAVEQLRAFRAAGGTVLFGTDRGYAAVDPRRELALMRAAGMDLPALLASLTTTPAARLGRGAHTGRLTPGAPADLVVLASDPARDAAALFDVAQVLRAGRQVWAR